MIDLDFSESDVEAAPRYGVGGGIKLQDEFGSNIDEADVLEGPRECMFVHEISTPEAIQPQTKLLCQAPQIMEMHSRPACRPPPLVSRLCPLLPVLPSRVRAGIVCLGRHPQSKLYSLRSPATMATNWRRSRLRRS